MDFALEKQMVDLYIATAYRQRIVHELCCAKKRHRVLHRLCHGYADRILPQVMHPIASSDAKKIARMLVEQGGQQNHCYLLSLLDACDGVFLPLGDALNVAVGNGMAALLYCGNEVAYFEAEQVQGPPARFLLKQGVGQGDRHPKV